MISSVEAVVDGSHIFNVMESVGSEVMSIPSFVDTDVGLLKVHSDWHK
jgi:hypothetical protein